MAVDSKMRHLAKYGYLWLRPGPWKNRQIVAASYIREASSNQVANLGGHYGYLWMTNDGQVTPPSAPLDAWFHTGTGGDRRTVLYICPLLDLVAVIGHHRAAYNLTPNDMNSLQAPFTASGHLDSSGAERDAARGSGAVGPRP